MSEVTCGRSPQEILDDFILSIIDRFPDQTLEDLMGLSVRQLNARAYALECQQRNTERGQWHRARNTSGRPFYNGSIF